MVNRGPQLVQFVKGYRNLLFRGSRISLRQSGHVAISGGNRAFPSPVDPLSRISKERASASVTLSSTIAIDWICPRVDTGLQPHDEGIDAFRVAEEFIATPASVPHRTLRPISAESRAEGTEPYPCTTPKPEALRVFPFLLRPPGIVMPNPRRLKPFLFSRGGQGVPFV